VSSARWTTVSTFARRVASAGSRMSSTRQVTPSVWPRWSSRPTTLPTSGLATSRAASAAPSPDAAPVTATTGLRLRALRPERTASARPGAGNSRRRHGC
jgi:hypothetical protein